MKNPTRRFRQKRKINKTIKRSKKYSKKYHAGMNRTTSVLKNVSKPFITFGKEYTKSQLQDEFLQKSNRNSLKILDKSFSNNLKPPVQYNIGYDTENYNPNIQMPTYKQREIQNPKSQIDVL